MAVSPRLPQHLRATLGSDAGEELVTILDEIRADRAQFTAEFTATLEELRREMHARFEQVDRRFERVDDRLLALDAKVGDVESDLMKWSFVFWCGAVASIAVLAGVLR